MFIKKLAGRAYHGLINHAQSRHVRLTDDHLKWLQTVNVGYLHPGNPYLFDYAIKRLPSVAPMVEIGSFCGLSTNVLTHYKNIHGAKNTLFTCDKWRFEDTDHVLMIDDTDISMEEYRLYVKEMFMRNVSFFSRNDMPHTLEMFSDEFFEKWHAGARETDVFGKEVELGGPISFAYIDGNHSYDFAQRDFENCDRVLERGGFIVFDDSSDAADFGSTRVAQAAARSGRYELIARNPNYLIQKK